MVASLSYANNREKFVKKEKRKLLAVFLRQIFGFLKVNQVQNQNIGGRLNVHNIETAVVSHGEHFRQTGPHLRGGELAVN